MIWILAILCLGLAGMAGYYRGPICAAFSTAGVIFGALFCKPLASLIQPIVSILELHNLVLRLALPRVLAFLAVLAVFKFAGNALHQKVDQHFKYKKDEQFYFRWLGFYVRLGLCVGLCDGVAWFFVLLIPIYIGGYFTTEATVDPASAPLGARIFNNLRAEIHSSNLDRVVAALDPAPPQVYQAADLVDLVLHNPDLASRLAHYPPVLALSQRKEVRDLATDPDFQALIKKQASPMTIINSPKVQSIFTNKAVTSEISQLGGDLPDLKEYLMTGKSAKFDPEKILGYWAIDIPATLNEDRKRNPSQRASQLAATRAALTPEIKGCYLLVTTDNRVLLKRQAGNVDTTLAEGKWTGGSGGYEVTLPGNLPDTVEVVVPNGDTLEMPRGGHVLIFNKQI